MGNRLSYHQQDEDIQDHTIQSPSTIVTVHNPRTDKHLIAAAQLGSDDLLLSFLKSTPIPQTIQLSPHLQVPLDPCGLTSLSSLFASHLKTQNTLLHRKQTRLRLRIKAIDGGLKETFKVLQSRQRSTAKSIEKLSRVQGLEKRLTELGALVWELERTCALLNGILVQEERLEVLELD